MHLNRKSVLFSSIIKFNELYILYVLQNIRCDFIKPSIFKALLKLDINVN